MRNAPPTATSKVAIGGTTFGGTREGVEVVWPLSHNGQDNVILQLPRGYAGRDLDRINTSEMRATAFPWKRTW